MVPLTLCQYFFSISIHIYLYFSVFLSYSTFCFSHFIFFFPSSFSAFLMPSRSRNISWRGPRQVPIHHAKESTHVKIHLKLVRVWDVIIWFSKPIINLTRFHHFSFPSIPITTSSDSIFWLNYTLHESCPHGVPLLALLSSSIFYWSFWPVYVQLDSCISHQLISISYPHQWFCHWLVIHHILSTLRDWEGRGPPKYWCSISYTCVRLIFPSMSFRPSPSF